MCAWCARVCYMLVICSIWCSVFLLISFALCTMHLSLFTIHLCTVCRSLLVISYHLCGSVCYVVSICAARSFVYSVCRFCCYVSHGDRFRVGLDGTPQNCPSVKTPNTVQTHFGLQWICCFGCVVNIRENKQNLKWTLLTFHGEPCMKSAELLLDVTEHCCVFTFCSVMCICSKRCRR
jgi:hypothetical protein